MQYLTYDANRIVILLSQIFKLMINDDVAETDFGRGIIIPLVKYSDGNAIKY